MELIKGDIYLVNFNPSKGGEIGKLRPAIIMSSEEENTMLSTVIVIPLSTVVEDNALPYRYPITKRERLKEKSDACIYEIRALSKIRVKEKLGQITQNELKSIQKALCEILG